ncbi:MAG: flagellar basal body rod protein FlgB [Gracilibacteraceae bacterium]|jgi:flagellar basal-body rod protein FlgB|nr:flagellar basal body rod protein FlgB [Gracilibacteraceae bacterium]
MDLFGLNTPVLRSIERGLDYASLRTKVLQHNIANIDTPNFKRSDLNFEVLLNQALGNNTPMSLRQTHERHLLGSNFSDQGMIYQDRATSTRNDNNNVDPDVEMTRLAENTYTYMYLSRAMTSYLGLFRQAYTTQG